MLGAYYQDDTGNILTHRHLLDGSPLFSDHYTCNMNTQEYTQRAMEGESQDLSLEMVYDYDGPLHISRSTCRPMRDACRDLYTYIVTSTHNTFSRIA